MKFSSSYEPNQFETDIYAAWEASGAFNPTTHVVPVDADADGHDDRLVEAGEPFSEDRKLGRAPLSVSRVVLFWPFLCYNIS